jgi:hypothetical protein
LADELQHAFDAVLSTDVPEALRCPRDYSYLLPPLSHGRTVTVALRQFLDAHPHVGLMLHPTKVLSVLSRRPSVRPVADG